MNPEIQLIVTAAFELGLPIILLAIAAFLPKARSWAVVMLGALTPFLLLYGVTLVRLFILEDKDAGWTYGGMWSMSLIPYIVCAVLGFGMGMIKVPRGGSMRYIVGLLPPALVGLIVSFFLNK